MAERAVEPERRMEGDLKEIGKGLIGSEKKKNRWCIVQNDTFLIFKNSREDQLIEEVCLDTCKFRNVKNDKKNEKIFQLVCPGKKILTFIAPTEDYSRWKNAISKDYERQKNLPKENGHPGEQDRILQQYGEKIMEITTDPNASNEEKDERMKKLLKDLQTNQGSACGHTDAARNVIEGDQQNAIQIAISHLEAAGHSLVSAISVILREIARQPGNVLCLLQSMRWRRPPPNAQ